MGLCLAQNSTRLYHLLKATQQGVLGFTLTYRDFCRQKLSFPEPHPGQLPRPGRDLGLNSAYLLSLTLRQHSLQCLAARGTALWLISKAVVLGNHLLLSAKSEGSPTIEALEILITQTHWMTSSLLDLVLRVRSPNAGLVWS